MAESDFFVNHKRYPRCKRSHIMYNHTLKGGLRAGNFSMLASVDDIEVCAALCCEEKYCDLGMYRYSHRSKKNPMDEVFLSFRLKRLNLC